MARKFLYGVAVAVLVVLAGAIALRFGAARLSQAAFVPTTPFSAPAALPPNAYAAPGLWLARPGKLAAEDATRWLPHGVTRGEIVPAAVFYVHPTSFFDRTLWNAPIGDALTTANANEFAGVQASVFNAAAQMWAPRYRQATFGAMLTAAPAGRQALDLAYHDVLAAFDRFVAATDPALPIVIVGHSQGALHVMRLLQDRVAGTPLARRIAAIYVPGWPVSVVHDLPAMGLPACRGPAQSGCILAWISYAEPADPSDTLTAYDRMPGLDGRSRKGTPILCTNPLTGGAGGNAPASTNLGTLAPATAGSGLVAGMVPARCSSRGFLLIGAGPQLGPQVMPGNDYHVYDIALFWANLRQDFSLRVHHWHQAHP